MVVLWELCGQERVHHWVLSFIEQWTPKKHLFLSPSKWLGPILLDCDGDKLCWEERQLKVGEGD